MSHTERTFLLVCISIFAPYLAYADSTALDSRTSLKVSKAKRIEAINKNKANENEANHTTSRTDQCASVDIGNIKSTKNGRSPTVRENTVIITGDVIVISGKNCVN